MTDDNVTPDSGKRQLWVRLIYMLIIALLWHVAEAVLGVVAIIQFIIALAQNKPNERLVAFGRSLARYLQQMAAFLTFASEEIPFPFSDWPSAG